MSDVFSYIVVPVLVPVIPAFILFKFLPGKASVNGKIRNIKINLVGGFGGYFAILWMLLPYVNGLRTQPVSGQAKQQFQVYAVTGTVNLEGKTGLPDDLVTFTAVLPPAYSVNPPDGGFNVNIPVGPGPSGTPDVPELDVEYGGYVTATLNLADANVATLGQDGKSIHINKPIILVPNPTGQEAQTAIPIVSKGG